MSRNRGTDRQGSSFGPSVVSQVWQKGAAIPGYDPNVWRRDICGHAIKFSEHGNINSDYGWEIDHIWPVAKNGSDNIANLQPLYWETNRDKADTYPWDCSMR